VIRPQIARGCTVRSQNRGQV